MTEARNCYAPVTALEAEMAGAASAVSASTALEMLEAASRQIDDFCGRHFFTLDAARIFTAQTGGLCLTDDLLAVSGVAVWDGAAYGDEWDEADFCLWPWNRLPARGVATAKGGTKCFRPRESRGVLVTGTWGYAPSEDPWVLLANGADLDGSATALALTGIGSLASAGHTIRLDDEQLFVEASSANALTVVRGVNGTAAAAHSGAAVFRATYPARIVRACATIAAMWVRDMGRAGLKSERLDTYSYLREDGKVEEAVMARLVGDFVRLRTGES